MTRKKVTFNQIVYSSSRMEQIVRTAERIANSDMLVLITGENGTGKETLAQAIHNASDRAEGRYVSVNCAALPDALLETGSSDTKKVHSPVPSIPGRKV